MEQLKMPSYINFATLLARFPDMLMVRKFDRLSIQLLLYMQAELLHLEYELGKVASWDAEDSETVGIDRCWKKMNQAFIDGKADMQCQKLGQIQEKLKAYRKRDNCTAILSLGLNIVSDETLLRTVKIQSLERPSNYSHSTVSDWLERKNGGDGFLEGREAEPWMISETNDLVSLHSKGDALDEKLASTLTPTYHRLFGHRQEPDVESTLGIGPVWEYKASYFSRFGMFLCVFVSCSVPIVSIIALYYAPNTKLRLALISVFTVLFSGIVASMTACRRSEIFAATAAFAAVQVVFLQGVNQVLPVLS